MLWLTTHLPETEPIRGLPGYQSFIRRLGCSLLQEAFPGGSLLHPGSQPFVHHSILLHRNSLLSCLYPPLGCESDEISELIFNLQILGS